MGPTPARTADRAYDSVVDPHRLAEQRSLAIHGHIARRLAREPGLLEAARRRVAGWLEDRSVHPAYAGAWARALAGPLEDLVRLLTDPGEEARALRQCSPFAGAVEPRERWRIWREVRHEVETSGTAGTERP